MRAVLAAGYPWMPLKKYSKFYQAASEQTQYCDGRQGARFIEINSR